MKHPLHLLTLFFSYFFFILLFLKEFNTKLIPKPIAKPNQAIPLQLRPTKHVANRSPHSLPQNHPFPPKLKNNNMQQTSLIIAQAGYIEKPVPKNSQIHNK